MRVPALLICLVLAGCAGAGTIPLGGEAPSLPGHDDMCKRKSSSELCPQR
jgi:hypothetical protein